MPGVPGRGRLMAPGLQLRAPHLLLRHLQPALLLRGLEPEPLQVPAEALPGLQSQVRGAPGHSCDPLHGHGHHLLLLLLPLPLPDPPAPAAAGPLPRPGHSNDGRPGAAAVPIPPVRPGPQGWPRPPTPGLHVAPQCSSPAASLPGRAPCLQPCSSSPLSATAACLSGNLRDRVFCPHRGPARVCLWPWGWRGSPTQQAPNQATPWALQGSGQELGGNLAMNEGW